MASVFGTNISGRGYTAPMGSGQWSPFGKPGSWFAAPATSPEARAWAIAYELLPYMSRSSQWDMLQWLNANSAAEGMSQNMPANVISNVSSALGGSAGLTGQASLGPGGIKDWVTTISNLATPGKTAANALSGFGTEESNWLQGLNRLSAMGTPMSRQDWQAYQSTLNSLVGQAPAAMQGIAASMLMPSTVAPDISSPFRATTGGWWK